MHGRHVKIADVRGIKRHTWNFRWISLTTWKSFPRRGREEEGPVRRPLSDIMKSPPSCHNDNSQIYYPPEKGSCSPNLLYITRNTHVCWRFDALDSNFLHLGVKKKIFFGNSKKYVLCHDDVIDTGKIQIVPRKFPTSKFRPKVPL